MKSTFYKSCDCGANLDPGEICDCQKEEKTCQFCSETGDNLSIFLPGLLNLEYYVCSSCLDTLSRVLINKGDSTIEDVFTISIDISGVDEPVLTITKHTGNNREVINIFVGATASNVYKLLTNKIL